MGLDGFRGPEHYPALVEGLQQRGYGESREAITHGNFMRVLREALAP